MLAMRGLTDQCNASSNSKQNMLSSLQPLRGLTHPQSSDCQRLRVDHDFTQHGTKQTGVSASHSGRLDVNKATSQRPATLDVQCRAEYGIVETRNVAADVLSNALLGSWLARRLQARFRFVVFGGGRPRRRRHSRRRLMELLPFLSRRPRPALRVVDENRDPFQVHHCVAVTDSCNTAAANGEHCHQAVYFGTGQRAVMLCNRAKTEFLLLGLKPQLNKIHSRTCLPASWIHL